MDNTSLVATDKESVTDFLKNMEKINSLKRLQDQLMEKFQAYKQAKETMRELRQEIKDLLDSSKTEKSIVDEITSEIFKK